MVTTWRQNRPFIGTTLAHELGHTLGLLQTHHPGRLRSLAVNDDNGSIFNGCFQESSDPNQSNGLACVLFGTRGAKKNQINGDFLRETPVDPSQGFRQDNNNILKRTSPTSDCEYENPGFGNDYTKDNSAGIRTPPIRNITSYTSFTCRNEFSNLQIGQMWHFIETEFNGHTGQVCSNGGRTVTLTNPPPNINISWTAGPDNLVHSSTRSGNGTTAFVRANSTNTGAYVSVTFHQIEDCNFFNTSVDMWVGASGFSSGDLNGPSTMYIGNTSSFLGPTANNVDYYSWHFPNGGFSLAV